MRIFILALHYPPEISGGVHRPSHVEKYLVNSGHEVHVFSPQDRTEGIYGAVHHTVPFPRYRAALTRSGSGRNDGTTVLSRLRKFLSGFVHLVAIPDRAMFWALSVVRACERAAKEAGAPDVIFSTSPPESLHLAGLYLSWKFGSRWVADVRDGWLFEPHKPQLANPLRRFAEGILERQIFSRADCVTFITKPIFEDACARFPASASRFLFVSSGFLSEAGGGAVAQSGEFVMGYCGRIGLSDHRRGIEDLTRGIQLFLEKAAGNTVRFRFELAGAFTAEEKDAFLARIPACHVTFQGVVPADKVGAFMAGCACLLLITPPHQRSIAPRKLFDYLSTGRPILAIAHENAAEEIIRETHSGVCVENNNPEQLAEALLAMYQAWTEGRLAERFSFAGSENYEATAIWSRNGSRVFSR